MKRLYLLSIIYIALITTGCATTDKPSSTKATTTTTTQTTKTPPKSHHKDNPLNVSIITHQIPQRPFVVLGEAKISKYNVMGIKRQEATLRDLLTEAAASKGGDAIINVKHDDKTVTATVIAYKQILV